MGADGEIADTFNRDIVFLIKRIRNIEVNGYKARKGWRRSP